MEEPKEWAEKQKKALSNKSNWENKREK